MNDTKMFDQSGYAALASVLLVSAVTLVLVTSFSLLSISSSQSTTEDDKYVTSFRFVESCVEDALMQIHTRSAITSPILLPSGSCTVVINAQSATTWTFTVTGTQQGYTKRIKVTAARNTNVSVTSWQEL